MQTLNLSGTRKGTDGRLKSLIWPTIDNAWDVDYLGQQGFWVCLIIGLINAVLFLVQASFLSGMARTIVLVIGAIFFFLHWVGGMGVREHSFPAAVVVFGTYALNQLAGGRISPLAIIIGGALLSNVRATYLASKWKPAEEGEDTPMRFNDTLRDKLVDQLPPKLWPILKIPFFISAALILLVIVYSVAVAATQHPTPANGSPAPAELQVAPPDTH